MIPAGVPMATTPPYTGYIPMLVSGEDGSQGHLIVSSCFLELSHVYTYTEEQLCYHDSTGVTGVNGHRCSSHGVNNEV